MRTIHFPNWPQVLSASSQRRALNARVFLFREVFGMKLGDLELDRLLGQLEEEMGLTAQVMRAAGSLPAGF